MDVIAEITDDLTTMSRNAIVKTMKREGNDLGEDFVNHTPDELRDIHRVYRQAHGLDGGVIDEVPTPGEGNEDQPKVEPLRIEAIAFRQLGHDCFSGVVTYGDLARLKANPESNRDITKSRVPKIKEYVAKNDGSETSTGKRRTGFFGAGVVNVVGGFTYIDSEHAIYIDPDAEIYIIDMQHRWRGISEYVASPDFDRERIDDAIAAVIYDNLTSDEMRQAFADINGNAMKPNRATMLSFDLRSITKQFVDRLVNESAVFRGKVNRKKTRIGAKDVEHFTYSNVYDAIVEMFDDITPDNVDERLAQAKDFWSDVDGVMGEHFDAKNFAVTKNGLVAIAGLYGKNVDWTKLGGLDWNDKGDLSRVAGEAGGSHGAIKALSDELKREVVKEDA